MSTIKRCLTVIISFSVFFITSKASASDIAIVDAGNGGTSAFLYQITMKPKATMPTIKLLGSKTLQTGITSFFDTPDQAGAAFAPLWNALQSLATKNHLTTVPVYFLATTNANSLVKQQAVYSSISAGIKNYPTLNLKKIETITYQQLSSYWWLSVNGRLSNLSIKRSRPTVGVFDVGATMTQIAFESDKIPNYEDEVYLKFGPRRYHLFIHSALLGMSAFQSALDKIPECDIAGMRVPAPAVDGGEVNKPNDGMPMNTVPFSAETCHQALIKFLSSKNLGNTVPTMPNNFKLIGLKGITRIAGTLNVNFPLTMTSLFEDANSACQQALLNANNNPQLTAAASSSTCVNGLYLYTLLSQGYHIAPNTPINTLSYVSSTPMNWTSGAALYYAVNGDVL